MILRCTGKVRALLGAGEVVDVPAGIHDWYLNLIWIERRKCLLLTHAGTVFSVFAADVRKADLAQPGAWASATIEAALHAEGLPDDALGDLDPLNVTIAKTASRQTLGYMNDLAMHAEHEIAQAGGLGRCDIEALNFRLRRTLHNHDGIYANPLELVAARAEN